MPNLNNYYIKTLKVIHLAFFILIYLEIKIKTLQKSILNNSICIIRLNFVNKKILLFVRVLGQI